jgi:DNA-directed RNA polymerase subunit M/transcription elongation factor TFIIS
MYYISISKEDENKMVYYCRNCGNIDADIMSEGVCVLNTQLKKDGNTFSHIINQYTKLDPTLPRIYNIKCPNDSCQTNAIENKEPAEVIYMRYDDDNMKYLYICVTCDMTWKTDDSK